MQFYRRDQPSKQEKIDMCQSIITAFPVLKHHVTGGIVSSIPYEEIILWFSNIYLAVGILWCLVTTMKLVFMHLTLGAVLR